MRIPPKFKPSPKAPPAPAPAPIFTSTRGNPLRGGSSRRSFKEGGSTKEPKAMVKKEVSFMKKKGAPKSMIKHEMAEAKGKPFKKGGSVTRADGVVKKGHTQGTQIRMMGGGKC